MLWRSPLKAVPGFRDLSVYITRVESWRSSRVGCREPSASFWNEHHSSGLRSLQRAAGTAPPRGCASCCPAPEHADNAARCWARLPCHGPAAWPASPSQRSQWGTGPVAVFSTCPRTCVSRQCVWAFRAGMLPQKRGWPGVLAQCWACVRRSGSLVASPGAEAAWCEVGVMISWGKAQGFPHPESGRKNPCWLEAAWLHLRLLGWAPVPPPRPTFHIIRLRTYHATPWPRRPSGGRLVAP